MAKLTRFPGRRDLSSRRTISVELPELLLCAIEHRLLEVNQGVSAREHVTLNQLFERELAESLWIAEVALLERDVPGIGAAVSEWLDEVAE
jgi:hypothetical protein